MIYLDNAATTFPKPEAVYAEMDRVNRDRAVNTGRGSYKAAREATELIRSAKDGMLRLFHAAGIYDVVFTPSVTHAMNQVIGGLDLTPEKNVYFSPYEHNAVARPLHNRLGKIDSEGIMLPLTDELEIDLDKTEFLFQRKPPDVLFVTAVSNVTGYMLPVERLTEMVHRHGGVVVIDAAQAAGLIPADLRKTAPDIVCFAGHKTLCGPFGIGGFLLRKGTELRPVFFGGTGSESLNLDMPDKVPERYEASSPNIVAIAGLYASLKELDVEEHYRTLKELTEYALMSLSDTPKVKLCGYHDGMDSIGIISFVVEGYLSDDVGSILDEEFDIAVRTGYHCTPYIHDYLKDKPYAGTVRIGLGRYNTKEDIRLLTEALKSL